MQGFSQKSFFDFSKNFSRMYFAYPDFCCIINSCFCIQNREEERMSWESVKDYLRQYGADERMIAFSVSSANKLRSVD